MGAASNGVGAPTFQGEAETVTLNDLVANPVDAMQRIGASLQKELSDPKTWLQAAALYFGPKLFNTAAPVVARAATSAKAGAMTVATPGMVKDLATVGLGEGRVSAGMRIGGRLADAVTAARGGTAVPEAGPVSTAPQPAPPVPAPPTSEPPPVSRPSGSALPDQRALNDAALARRRADYQARVSAPKTADTPGRPPEKWRLTAAESKAYMDLRHEGKTHAQAVQAIATARAFQQRFGTPSTPDVAAAVRDRNASGRWPE